MSLVISNWTVFVDISLSGHYVAVRLMVLFGLNEVVVLMTSRRTPWGITSGRVAHFIVIDASVMPRLFWDVQPLIYQMLDERVMDGMIGGQDVRTR